MADRDGVRIESLEPRESEEAAFLVPRFPPGAVKLFYFSRNLADSAGEANSLDARCRSAQELVRHRQRQS